MADTIRLEKFDAAEYLNTAEECALYLKEFAGDENQILLISAITDVTRRSSEEVSKGNTEMGIEAIVAAMKKEWREDCNRFLIITSTINAYFKASW